MDCQSDWRDGKLTTTNVKREGDRTNLATDASQFRKALQSMGLSTAVIDAAWPDWWCEEAESSPSARAELRFSLARKLGLDPRSLLDDGEPRFVWRDEAKFKGRSTEDEQQCAAIESFGAAIGRHLLSATPPSDYHLVGLDAKELRKSILSDQPFIRLTDLIVTCWAMGMPIIHLKVFPLPAKHMCAMAVQVEGRFVIMLGKDSEYPAPIAYYLAHELGHIALGHLGDRFSVIDLKDPLEATEEWDDEEKAADRYALELLTGNPSPVVTTEAGRYTAPQLAAHLNAVAEELRIEPGTLALCFGHSTKDWPRAMAAMKLVYRNPIPVWSEVNGIASHEIQWDALSDDTIAYIRAVMGGVAVDNNGG